MAHKIDFTKGKAAFIASQTAAWHGLGQVFTEDITVNDALHSAGLDFHVQKCPNIHQFPESTDFIVSDSSFFTYRTDANKVLGSRLGPDYTVYQNTEALAVVDELIATGDCKIETAGAIDEGRRVFVCLKFNGGIKVGLADHINQYVLLANSHDGTLAITAMPTNVRVVCNNTLGAALSGAKAQHKIRHTKNAADRVKEAFEIMGLLAANKRINEAAYNAMKHTVVTKQEFFDYIGNVFMTPAEIKDLQAGKRDTLSTRKKNIIKDVLEFAETGIGQHEALGNDLNMWYGYNAITGYLTGKKYSTGDDRFNSLIFGDSAIKIKEAGDLALKPSSIQSLRQTNFNSLN
jgi:phage/plasmid-like protein (TIGR03299 family)